MADQNNVLEMEARLKDLVSKGLDSINTKLIALDRNGSKGVKSTASAFEKLNGVLASASSKGTGLLRDLLKFSGLKAIFDQLKQASGLVFEAMLVNSPKIRAQWEDLKKKANSLITEIAERGTPMLIAAFNVIIKNWDKVRYAFAIGGAAMEDAFHGILGTFYTLATGVLQGATWITKGLSMVGLASKETASGFDDAATEMAEKAATQFGKVGKTVEVVKAGLEGLGKYTKTTEGLFGMEDKGGSVDAPDMAARRAKEREIMQRGKEEGRAMLKEEREFKISATRATEDALFDAMKEGVEKRLVISAFDEERRKQDFERSALFSTLSTQEQQDLLTAIEQAGSEERVRINQEENMKKLEAGSELVSNLANLAAVSSSINRKKLQKEADAEIKIIEKKEQAGYLSKEQAEKAKEKVLQEVDQKNKERAKLAKNLARLEALVNIALGVTKAYAQGGFLGLLTGASVAAAGAVQLATINAQEFETGGFPQGRNAHVIMNENGQESVLNADATRRLGRDGVDALNNGGNSGSVNIDMGSTTIVVQGGSSSQEIKRVVEENDDRRLRKLKSDLRSIGYKNV